MSPKRLRLDRIFVDTHSRDLFFFFFFFFEGVDNGLSPLRWCWYIRVTDADPSTAPIVGTSPPANTSTPTPHSIFIQQSHLMLLQETRRLVVTNVGVGPTCPVVSVIYGFRDPSVLVGAEGYIGRQEVVLAHQHCLIQYILLLEKMSAAGVVEVGGVPYPPPLSSPSHNKSPLRAQCVFVNARLGAAIAAPVHTTNNKTTV
uniref:Uncharacterized protein n=1 Tax=Timema douglasi TaxID=61478 RepID=A0A7R8VBV7_TIMDO|nr:unnamed protein product [Timema douglasi]